MMNHPWVVARASATAQLIEREFSSPELAVEHLHRVCFGRPPTQAETANCVAFLVAGHEVDRNKLDSNRLTALVQSLFASLDFRYLE
jgi:hypothetical protein